MKKLLLTVIVFAAGFFAACTSLSGGLPGNVKVIGTINEEIAVESGNTPNAASVLFVKAQEKHGNNIGIINVKYILINSRDGKEIWSGSATVIRMKDDNYQKLYNKTPKSGGRIYGAGSAQMATPGMSMTMALTRARTEIARSYSSIVEKSGERTVTITNAAIKGDRTEQIVFTPNGTVWVMLSVNKED